MQLQRVFWLAAAALVVATATPAMAQNLGGNLDAGIDVQRFEGVTSPYGVFSVDSARSAHHLQLSGGVLVNYSKDPLIFHASNGDKFPIVTQQVAAELLFGLGLFDFMEVGVALPIYLSNDASVGAEDLSGATVGDLRLRPKLTLLDQDETGFGLAVLAYITTPTGDDAAFASNGQFSVRPGLAATTGTDKLEIMLNLSADVQGERQFGDLQLGSELLFGLGAQYELVNGLLLGTEVYGSTDFGQFFEEQETPVEGLIGLKYRLAGGLNFELAAGRGITRGYGAPAARVIGGIRYAEYNDDLDGDGILNRDDACKHDAEDVDLFEDEDGCPDPDNDGDGVPDKSDDCPNRAEDPDGFQDADGCPDPDNDSDGVPDAEDECPDIAGLAELAGCPKPDQDDDGVLDKDDKCPDVPEDADGFEDEDG